MFNTSLNNALTRGNKKEIVGWAVPDYSAGVSKTSNTEYIADSDGYIMAQCFRNSTSGTETLSATINGTTLAFKPGATDYGRSQMYLPIKKGDVYQIVANSDLYFYPARY